MFGGVFCNIGVVSARIRLRRRLRGAAASYQGRPHERPARARRQSSMSLPNLQAIRTKSLPLANYRRMSIAEILATFVIIRTPNTSLRPQQSGITSGSLTDVEPDKPSLRARMRPEAGLEITPLRRGACRDAMAFEVSGRTDRFWLNSLLLVQKAELVHCCDEIIPCDVA